MSPPGWLRAEILARLAMPVDAALVTVESGGPHGELVTNAALVAGGRDARALAERLAAALRSVDGVARAEIGGAGFVNVFLDNRVWHDSLAEMLADLPGKVVAGGAAAGLAFPFADSGEWARGNPAFRIQYAHARCHSVLAQAVEMWPEVVTSGVALARAPLARLTAPVELGLIRLLAGWPRSMDGGPGRLAGFLLGLATGFDAWWDCGPEGARLRLLQADDAQLSLARLGLVRAVASVIAAGLSIFGIQPVEEMR